MRNTSEKKASLNKERVSAPISSGWREVIAPKGRQKPIPRILIAGIRGGSGKTILSIGLLSALRQRGINVIPFKKGPDYIDSGWLSSSSKTPCYNLDPFLMGEKKILISFIEHSHDFDFALIEGNRGIYDGMDAKGRFSTARLSKMLNAPVILIVDCTKMTATTAALILGIKNFDPDLRLSGIILNQVAGRRHENVIRESLKKSCNIPLLGAIPKQEEVLPERHMGLTPWQEHPEVEDAILKITEIIKKYVDIDGIIAFGLKAGCIKKPLHFTSTTIKSHKPLNIGIIKDSAFQFYYPENFEELQKRGAKLIKISALKDKVLPDLNALYIGGGFPETHAIALSKNIHFKKALLKAIEEGLPVYAECGGLMYLGQSLILKDKVYPMAGVFPIRFSIEQTPNAHGYTIVELIRTNPFYKKGTVLKGHEFHYSRVMKIGKKKGVYLAMRMRRGKGIINGMDGICYKNVLATYTHIHALGSPQWINGMLSIARQ